jgi:hypothetical protein
MVNRICSTRTNTSWDTKLVGWLQRITRFLYLVVLLKVKDLVDFLFLLLAIDCVTEFLLFVSFFLFVLLVKLLLLLHQWTWGAIPWRLWIRALLGYILVTLVLSVVHQLAHRCLFDLGLELGYHSFLFFHLFENLDQNWLLSIWFLSFDSNKFL